jgi:hypothetical protein
MQVTGNCYQKMIDIFEAISYYLNLIVRYIVSPLILSQLTIANRLLKNQF